MNYQLLPWLITVVAIIIACWHYSEARVYKKRSRMYGATVSSYSDRLIILENKLHYANDEVNRLRFFVGLSYEPPVSSDKVIVLERRKKHDNPLTPTIL